jgi:uncharacterized protein YndB with AHSA1/START domain
VPNWPLLANLFNYDQTQRTADMTKIEYETDINAPVDRVYEYYTNPDNIKEAWPRDVVKESESTTSSKNEPGSEMKVKVSIWEDKQKEIAD